MHDQFLISHCVSECIEFIVTNYCETSCLKQPQPNGVHTDIMNISPSDNDYNHFHFTVSIALLL